MQVKVQRSVPELSKWKWKTRKKLLSGPVLHLATNCGVWSNFHTFLKSTKGVCLFAFLGLTLLYAGASLASKVRGGQKPNFAPLFRKITFYCIFMWQFFGISKVRGGRGPHGPPSYDAPETFTSNTLKSLELFHTRRRLSSSKVGKRLTHSGKI